MAKLTLKQKRAGFGGKRAQEYALKHKSKSKSVKSKASKAKSSKKKKSTSKKSTGLPSWATALIAAGVGAAIGYGGKTLQDWIQAGGNPLTWLKDAYDTLRGTKNTPSTGTPSTPGTTAPDTKYWYSDTVLGPPTDPSKLMNLNVINGPPTNPSPDPPAPAAPNTPTGQVNPTSLYNLPPPSELTPVLVAGTEGSAATAQYSPQYIADAQAYGQAQRAAALLGMGYQAQDLPTFGIDPAIIANYGV
jgi:hypothetical protein